MLVLEGPSGSGKTTLLQLLGALDTPSTGQLRFGGRSLEHESDRILTGIRSAEIGFVFQQFNLDSTNAKELMALLHDLHRRSRVTIIIATHDEDIAAHTQRRIRLRDGSIIADTRNDQE
ncbi:MAG TPA: ATP-binding cassette domain-containing protein [Acidimicrobiales bacterium]|jgi:ABC-type lipoprotein export system ATPase subunit